MRSRKKVIAARAIGIVVGLLVPLVIGSAPSEAQTGRTTTQDQPTTAAPARPTTATTAPAQQTTAVKYGPYQQQAAPMNPDGSHGHWHSGNQFALGVEKPCTNCYITGMTADLVYPDGTRAGFSTGSQLHHMVLFNQDAGRADATCNPGFPLPLGALGQRFFASGDERTPIIAPAGYGYYVGSGANWNLIWDLAGTSTEPKTVYYQVTFNWVPAPADLTNLEPVWFDVNQCGDSTFVAPAGPVTRSWTWNVNRPGDIVGIGGHGHDGTINIEIKNDTTGQVICDSRAGYGEDPLYIDHHGVEHISSMSICAGTPVAKVSNGQQVTMRAHYDMAKEDPGQMGIVVAFVGAPRSPSPGGCETAVNSDHVTAGRATSFLIWAWAAGSGTYIGATWDTTSLKEGPAGTWSLVDSC